MVKTEYLLTYGKMLKYKLPIGAIVGKMTLNSVDENDQKEIKAILETPGLDIEKLLRNAQAAFDSKTADVDGWKLAGLAPAGAAAVSPVSPAEPAAAATTAAAVPATTAAAVPATTAAAVPAIPATVVAAAAKPAPAAPAKAPASAPAPGAAATRAVVPTLSPVKPTNEKLAAIMAAVDKFFGASDSSVKNAAVLDVCKQVLSGENLTRAGEQLNTLVEAEPAAPAARALVAVPVPVPVPALTSVIVHTETSAKTPVAASASVSADVPDVDVSKYEKMQKVGLPEGAVEQQMRKDGMTEVTIAKFFKRPLPASARIVVTRKTATTPPASATPPSSASAAATPTTPASAPAPAAPAPPAVPAAPAPAGGTAPLPRPVTPPVEVTAAPKDSTPPAAGGTDPPPRPVTPPVEVTAAPKDSTPPAAGGTDPPPRPVTPPVEVTAAPKDSTPPAAGGTDPPPRPVTPPAEVTAAPKDATHSPDAKLSDLVDRFAEYPYEKAILEDILTKFSSTAHLPFAGAESSAARVLLDDSDASSSDSGRAGGTLNTTSIDHVDEDIRKIMENFNATHYYVLLEDLSKMSQPSNMSQPKTTKDIIATQNRVKTCQTIFKGLLAACYILFFDEYTTKKEDALDLISAATDYVDDIGSCRNRKEISEFMDIVSDLKVKGIDQACKDNLDVILQKLTLLPSTKTRSRRARPKPKPGHA
jgi:hypothetical protein